MAQAIERIMGVGIATMKIAQPEHQRMESNQHVRKRRRNNYRDYNYNRQTSINIGIRRGLGYSNNNNSRRRDRKIFQRAPEIIREVQISNERIEEMDVTRDVLPQ